MAAGAVDAIAEVREHLRDAPNVIGHIDSLFSTLNDNLTTGLGRVHDRIDIVDARLKEVETSLAVAAGIERSKSDADAIRRGRHNSFGPPFVVLMLTTAANMAAIVWDRLTKH